MVLEELPDHRRSSERDLLAALQARDPLALAEAYYRTVGAANACARRLLGPGPETEALLRAVYRRLWQEPPGEGPLEGWVRVHSFALAAEYLRSIGRPAASASSAALLPDLGVPEHPLADPAEELLTALDAEARAIVLRAHDRGMTTDQGDPGTAAALERALMALAGPVAAPVADAAPDAVATMEATGDDADEPTPAPPPGPRLGDWTLGLLAPEEAGAVAVAVLGDPALGVRAHTLRRGRRRLEGLPPGSDVGQRVLAAILAPLVTPLGAVPDVDVPEAGPDAPQAQVADGAEPEAPEEETEEKPSRRRRRGKARGLGRLGSFILALCTVLGLTAIVLSNPR